MKRAVNGRRWMATRRRASSASTVNWLEKCSLVDVDQRKCYFSKFWVFKVLLALKRWCRSSCTFLRLTCRRSTSTAGFFSVDSRQPFSSCQNFFLLNLKIAEYTVLALNGTSFLYLRNLALNYKCVFLLHLSLSLSLSLPCMKKPFLLMMYHSNEFVYSSWYHEKLE